MFQRIYIITLILFLMSATVRAQLITDYAIQLKADVQTTPPKITLSWAPIPGATGYTIYRKSQAATSWGAALGSVTATTYTDNNVAADMTYEYKVQQNGGNTASGYVFAGITAPPVHARGAMLLLVDDAFTNSCATEIDRLMKDISGDGWQVIRKDFASTANDVTVRNFIITTKQTHTNLNAVYILGHIAVPYSGEINPDGHTDHIGAWPADVYYADVNDTWTDNVVNNASATRVENENIPGDGKWDQSLLPGDLELQVGRVDFNNMPTFAKTEAEMMKSYLNRAHTYKMDSLGMIKRALVDNNFSAAAYPEAFAAGAYRNFPVLVGKDSIKTTDLISTLNTTAYQWAYGCGGGSYTSAGGIGSTTDFKNNDVNAIFVMLFGSYFGDWAAQNNFLRAPLCSDVPALASCWSGRPHWYFHHMALGEHIGYSTLLSQNNSVGLYDPTGYGARFVHNALMGDPSLRTDYIMPARNVTLTSAPQAGADVSWTASGDAGVAGYYVYRSDDRFGVYTKRSNLITGTSFHDAAGTDGLKYYMVRPVKLQTTPSGTYCNMGIGEVDSEMVSYPVSVKDETVANNALKIYPNPATDIVNIEITTVPGLREMQLAITDVSGRVVYNGVKLQAAAGSLIPVMVEHLQPGIYQVIVTTGKNVHTAQFIKTGK